MIGGRATDSGAMPATFLSKGWSSMVSVTRFVAVSTTDMESELLLATKSR